MEASNVDQCLESVDYIFPKISSQRVQVESRAFLFSGVAAGSSPERIKPCPAPSLKWVRPIPYMKKIELIGLFGEEPSDGNRSVKIDNVAMVVEKWEPESITILLPNTPVKGEVKVISRGRESNSRWLGEWSGNTTILITGEQSLKFSTTIHLRFIADPWPYREHAGQKPVDQFVCTMATTSGSTCSWNASGKREYDGFVKYAWSGSCNPKPFEDGIGALRKGTFGVGAIIDNYNKTTWMSFNIHDDMTLNPPPTGYPNGLVPVKLGAITNGQAAVQTKLGADFPIIGDTLEIEDEPSKFSYGGENGTVIWPTMDCIYPMPRNAAR